jgi:hypothetical protein
MATGTNIRTYFEGTLARGRRADHAAADHGAWLGTTVFDGARYVNGVAPDLDQHLARVNRSAEALMIEPSHSVEEMLAIVLGGAEALSRGCRRLHPPDVLGDRRRLSRHPAAGRNRRASASASKRSRWRPRPPRSRSPPRASAARCWKTRWSTPRRAAFTPTTRGCWPRCAPRATATRWWPMRWATSPNRPPPTCLHGARRRGLHPDPQRHLPVRDHPRAAHRQPARRRARGARDRADLRRTSARPTRCSSPATCRR